MATAADPSIGHSPIKEKARASPSVRRSSTDKDATDGGLFVGPCPIDDHSTAEGSYDGRRPTEEEAAELYDPIPDGQADIAIRSDNEKMQVEVTGRRPMQKVWLWVSDAVGKKTKSHFTNKRYDPEKDGPDAAGLPLYFPTEEEFTPHELAVQYLEVGIMFGDDPDLYRAKGQSRNAMRETERKNRGAAKRDPHAMRAFIPVSDEVKLQAKYYVGVHPTRGRCYPRVIEGDCIFFYAEFWEGMPANAVRKQRREILNQNAKLYAADDNMAAERATPRLTDIEPKRRAESNLLVTTPSEDADAQVELGDRQSLDHLNKTAESTHADLKAGTWMATASAQAFLDFDGDLSDDDAQSLLHELKAAHPFMPELEVPFVQNIRSIMVSMEWQSRLRSGDLAGFLDACFDLSTKQCFADEGGKGEPESAANAWMNTVVDVVLATSQALDKYRNS